MNYTSIALAALLLAPALHSQVSEEALKLQFKQVSENKRAVISTAASADRAKAEAISTIGRFEKLLVRLEKVNLDLLENLSSAPLTSRGLIEYNRETRSLSNDLLDEGESLLKQGETMTREFFQLDQAYERTITSYTEHLRMYQENYNAIVENPNMTESQKQSLLQSYDTSKDSVVKWIEMYKTDKASANVLSTKLSQALTFTVESIKYLNLAQTTANIGVNDSSPNQQQPLRELISGLQERISVLKAEIKKSIG